MLLVTAMVIVTAVMTQTDDLANLVCLGVCVCVCVGLRVGVCVWEGGA